MRVAVWIAAIAALVVALALSQAGTSSDPDPSRSPRSPHRVSFLCLQLDIHGNLVLIDLDLGIVVDIGAIFGYPSCPPPPPTTTTTTTTMTTTTTTTLAPTTTTTLPPPPPPPPPPPAPTTTTTTAPPPPPTTTTSTTLPPTTTTTLPPPPPPPPPPPAQLSVTATVKPSPPVPGQAASVVLLVRNDGAGTVRDVQLADDVSQVAALRSATSPAGPCRIAGRRATCPLGTLAPGEVVTAELRLLVDSAPASRTLLQHVSLSTGTEVSVTDRSVSALVGDPPSDRVPLTDLPGPTVTLVAFVGFVLASGGTRAR